MKGVRMGTLGRVPLENFHQAVEAAPNHDTFAVGGDLCFILAHPDRQHEDVNMWTHSVTITLCYHTGYGWVGENHEFGTVN